MSIAIRRVRDELDSFDELQRQGLCAGCADSAEARASDFRRAFEKAAAKGDRDGLVCANCAARWMPGADINHAGVGLDDDSRRGALVRDAMRQVRGGAAR
jgi:hypothetical protein